MKNLLLIYVALAVIAIAVIGLPDLLNDPMLKPTRTLPVNHKIEAGDLELVPEGALYMHQEVTPEQTIEYSDLARKPSVKRQLGHVPLAVTVTRSDLETARIHRNRTVLVCGKTDTETLQVSARVDSTVCGYGVQDCLAIVQVKEADRDALASGEPPTITTKDKCE